MKKQKKKSNLQKKCAWLAQRAVQLASVVLLIGALTSAQEEPAAKEEPSQWPQESAANRYLSAQAQRLRVNVSNLCERQHMRVTVRLNRPFYGLIHTKDKRKKAACQVEGNGEQSYTLEISYTLVQSEPAFCGVVSHHLNSAAGSGNTSTGVHQQQQQQQQTLSVALVVRLHKTIEFSDDRYFLLSCANRCARPDCSSTQPANAVGRPNSAANQLARGFLSVSESILAPVSRAVAPPSTGSNSSPEAPSAGAVCDSLLDLKFQWLVKLCWILALLLLLAFCVAYCLCLALNKRRLLSARKTTRPQLQRKNALNKSIKSQSNLKEIVYPPASTQAGQQAAQSNHLTSTWSTSLNLSTEADSQSAANGELEKIRKENSYLADQQHQQQLMYAAAANLLSSAAAESQQQQQSGSLEHPNAANQMLLNADLFNSAQDHQRQLDARVKRRRSIGSFAASKLNPPEANYEAGELFCNNPRNHLLRQQLSSNRLEPGARFKSKSQTTVHYNQEQDPFETAPFSYLNNGYLSDGAASAAGHGLIESQANPFHQEQLDCSQQQQHSVFPISMETGMQQTLPTTYHQQNPMTVQAKPQQPIITRPELMRHQKRSNFKPSYVPPPQAESVQPINLVPQQQQPLTSQFDPQNSRQLIDLIQFKHRQQIAHANRTAASMQELPRQPSLSASRQQARAWM